MILPNSLVSDGILEEATPGTFGAATPLLLPDTKKNYAENEKVRQMVQNIIVPILTQTRNDRQNLNYEWNAIRNMELLQHDDGQKYRGRSDAYLPIYNRSSQTLIAALSKGLFPSDEYFDVTSPNAGELDAAKAVKQYMKWEFEKVAHVRKNMKQFLKQFVNYGTSPLKYTYQQQPRYSGRLRKNDMGAMMGGQFKPNFDMDGLRVSARSLFNWYVYPSTASDLDEATCIFEDIRVSLEFIRQKIRSGQWARADIAESAPTPSELEFNEDELFNARGMTNPVDQGGEGLGNQRAITECWTFLKLPKSAYLPEEDSGCPVSCLIILAGNEPVFIGRNPYWHQRAPYSVARMNTEPGFFYGYGYGKVIRGLQYLSNDFANQTADVGTIGINPYALVNSAYLNGPLPPLKPGAVIPVTDVNLAIKWDRPPTEILQYGQGMVGMFSGMAQDYSGAPPILQGMGNGSGGAGKTATGAQLLQRNATAPLQDVVEDIEQDVMLPLLQAAWINAQQFRTDEIMIQVAGQSLKINPSVLAIDAQFTYLASSQAVNQQQRSFQAMQLLQAVMPLAPALQQQGYVIDPVPLVKRIFNDSMGFRGFDDFIHKMNPQEQMGMMQQAGAVRPAQNPGSPGAEQGDMMRSFVDQAAGAGQTEMQPGEGEEGAAVRDNADQMAAIAGTNGGVE